MVDSNSGSDLISWRISGKCIFVSIIGSSCAICCFGITGSQLQSSLLSSWKDSDKPGEEKLLILPHHFPVKIESYFWNALLFSCQNRINLCSSIAFRLMKEQKLSLSPDGIWCQTGMSTNLLLLTSFSISISRKSFTC